MKTLWIKIFSVFIFLLTAHMSTVLAEPRWQLLNEWPQESGWSGYIQLLAGGYSGKGLNNVEKENRHIENLDANANDYQQEIVTAYWELNYKFNKSNTSLFIGTPDSGVTEFLIPLELGIRHVFTDETLLSIAYVPELSDVNNNAWQDPYLIEKNRQKTDIVLEAIRFSAEYILGLPFSVTYDYGEQIINNDRAGESLAAKLTSTELKKLQRDKKFSHARLSLTLPLTNNVYLIPEVNRTRANADGKANSYVTTGFEVTVLYQTGRFDIFGHVYLNNSKYLDHNPIFNIKRKDTGEGATFGVSYLTPFNMKNTAFDLITNFTRRDSNIQFYDRYGEALMLGLSHSF